MFRLLHLKHGAIFARRYVRKFFKLPGEVFFVTVTGHIGDGAYLQRRVPHQLLGVGYPQPVEIGNHTFAKNLLEFPA